MQLEKLYRNLRIQDMNAMQKNTYKVTENQQDVVLLSPTGSGKTLAFLFPILRALDPESKQVQCLIMVPARELAQQIEEVFKSMKTGYKVSCCYGGRQTRIEQNNLLESPAVLIGTPGRIAYHLRNENFDPTTITTLVLDEFDKALEFGFQEDMRFIIEQMTNLKQRILTSATRMRILPAFAGLDNHEEVNFLNNQQAKPRLTYKKITTIAEEKLDALFKLICKVGDKRMLIFCNHRDAVDRIGDLLERQRDFERSISRGYGTR